MNVAAVSKEEVLTETNARAALYRSLSSLYFVELDEDALERLATSDLGNANTGIAGMDEGYSDMGLYLARRTRATRQELASDFAGAILGAGAYDERRATPYESVFTSESGLLMQEARDDVYRMMCEAHLAVDEGLRMPEDHISFEFEFMAVKAEAFAQAVEEERWDVAGAALKVQRNFHERHLLNWIDEYCACLESCARTRFYKGLAKLTSAFVHADADAIASDGAFLAAVRQDDATMLA